ncbi:MULTISPECIES: hypothetical protein [unclassified Streptomyces]|uniref:hypothetical protein n=1 Tax=unclassified Streptomyces TaxID=2593676 RepID=UPI0034275BA7
MKRAEEQAEDTCRPVFQCRLSLSTRTVNRVADLLCRHLRAIRSRWWILPPGKIVVIVLAVLRHDQRLADLAGGNNISESTVRAGATNRSSCSPRRPRAWTARRLPCGAGSSS